VISPEQLAQALERIHPRDRELLALSLRRRVPDEALARLYDCESTEVARRRARAIERLADEMDLQRGEDLGAVLKALLEPDTWSAVSASVGEEFAVKAGSARLTPVPPPDDAEISAARGPILAPVPVPAAEPAVEEEEVAAGEAEPAAPPASPPADGEPAAPPAPADGEPAAPPPTADAASPATAEPSPEEPASVPPTADAAASPAPASPAPAPPADATQPPADAAPPHPVLEMLAAREREVPDPPRRAVPLALAGIGIASLVGAAGIVGATQFDETNRVITPRDTGGGDDNTRHFLPAPGDPLAAPFPTDPRSISCYTTAYVPKATVLYREPGGRKRMRITAKTEWGSPRVLGVVEQRGGWLGVQAAELRNGEVGWVRRGNARVDCVEWSLHADLSKRMLFVRRDGRTVRKMRVAVGRPSNPTPKGRFTVTDKLRVTDRNSPYGCCVLALSGHQTNLPDYWPGGDRLAVHATTDESSVGDDVSLGCLRTVSTRARWLIETVPLGSPIFIRA
jgi:L,D-transpeptidase catalytic domain